MLKVFISHKDTDESLARAVAGRVTSNQMDVYLDSIDSALRKDGSDLADYLLGRMAECDQLLAVLSSETAKSWWVPWEIGVGSEKRFRLATFARTAVVLPDYLKKWPVLRTLGHVDLYCDHSKRAAQSVRTEKARALSESQQLRVERSGVSNFHRDLRSALARSPSY